MFGYGEKSDLIIANNDTSLVNDINFQIVNDTIVSMSKNIAESFLDMHNSIDNVNYMTLYGTALMTHHSYTILRIIKPVIYSGFIHKHLDQY